MLIEKKKIPYAECYLVAAALLGHTHFAVLLIFLIKCIPSQAEMPSVTASYKAKCTTELGLSPKKEFRWIPFYAMLDLCPDVDKTPSCTHV